MAKKDTKLQQLSELVSNILDELNTLDEESLDELFMEEYMKQAEELTDSRQQSKVKHLMKDVIGIVFFGVLAGNNEWVEIADFAMDERNKLKKYLSLENGIPSHDTMERVFSIIDSTQLQQLLVGVLVELVETSRTMLDEYLYKNEELDVYVKDVIAADGKETHRTGKKNGNREEEKRNLNELNVMSTEWGISLSTTRISEKSNEIPELQKVLLDLDCRGCIVTADALNTQKETAKSIVEHAHGDYVLALKGNHKTAYEEVVEYFSNEEFLKEIEKDSLKYQKETETMGGKIIIREYFITDDIAWFADKKEWKKLTSIGYERKTIKEKEQAETHIEERYYLCSIKPIAELFAIVVRRHWHIENALHWTLDVVFKEDKLKSKEKKAVHNLGLIRRFVMFIIKLLKAYYHRSMKRIRAKIGRNLEAESQVVLAVLKVLYDNDLLDSIDEFAKNYK